MARGRITISKPDSDSRIKSVRETWGAHSVPAGDSIVTADSGTGSSRDAATREQRNDSGCSGCINVFKGVRVGNSSVNESSFVRVGEIWDFE